MHHVALTVHKCSVMAIMLDDGHDRGIFEGYDWVGLQNLK